MEKDKKYLICIDPGHGPGTVNGSPDGTYKEREFAWDMGQRITALLEEAGVSVVLTRLEDTKPSLTQRAMVSNNMGADLFVSLHSNAAGSSGWSDPSGLLIYTSQAGATAERNKLARSILSKMEAAGVKLFGGELAHNGYTVLTATNAPAVLIEYGFHTNAGDVARLKDSAYRDKLAEATTAGILDYLGLSEAEEDREEGLDNIPDPWAAVAVDKAIKAGAIQGSDTGDLALHSTVDKQTLIVILDRLGLLEERAQ